MFSLFPDLLAFGILGVFFIRVVVGFFFFREGYRLLQRMQRSDALLLASEASGLGTMIAWFLVIAELLIGILFVLGLFTQGAALAGMFIAGGLGMLCRLLPHLAPQRRTVYVFAFTICFALLFLGAGAFGFDHPL